MAGNTAIHRIALGISLLLICSISFYQGYTNAINDDSSVITANGVVVPKIKNSQTTNAADCLPHANPDEMNKFRQRVDGRVKMELDRLPKSFSSASSKIIDDGQSSKRAESPLFPDTMKSFAAGALRVSRDDLMKSYDVGVPFKKVPGEEQDALILYNSQNALPSNRELNHAAVHGSKEGDGSIAKSTVSEAMERCDTFNVVFLPLKAPNGPGLNECYSLIGNFESYHINRWMRIPEFTEQNKKERQLNKELPLRHIGRITKANGINEFDLPELWKRGEKGFLLQHFDALRTFLENVDTVLKDLKNLLDDRKVVKNNTVVVLTVNKGQSELLSNFICSARSRGFDVGNILVFPTDLESKALSEGLGVATYYDEKNLGALPSGEAKMYGDPIFAAMMYAKILCVVYPSLLGLDVLFQDVDIVWYKE